MKPQTWLRTSVMDQPVQVLDEVQLAHWAQTLVQSPLRELLATAVRPDILSFALGMPAADLFPTQDYADAVAYVLENDPQALQYGLPCEPLKAHIVSLMEQRGVHCRKEQIFLTTGAQHAMSLLAHLLLDPGGQVMIEETTYDGLPTVIKPFKPEILTVPTDAEHGIDTDAMEDLLIQGARPAFLYTIPTGHNPLGNTLSYDKQERLVELARKYRVPIIEDDAYGLLYYDGQGARPLRALDDQWVFYVGSFSKILAPALRIGWLVVSDELSQKLSVVKHASDMDVASLSQRATSVFLDAGLMNNHLAKLRRVNQSRRDTMLRALEENFPGDVYWNKPASGIFIWVELPPELDAVALLKVAVEVEKVAFVPGRAFCMPGRTHANHCLRLNFSNCTPERIEEGITRLGRVVRNACLS
jgi:2-aminoadipate transaminase